MFRIGFGVDSHRFQVQKTDKKLVLGGIEIPNHAGVESHSDGDVILHALFNAFSSAIGEKNIGQFFPDNDPQWRGKNSEEFIRTILQKVNEKKYSIGNVVISLECKTPKISLHDNAIKEKIAGLLHAQVSQIAVHATSGEGLTPFGKGEGIYCQAVVLLTSPTPKDGS